LVRWIVKGVRSPSGALVRLEGLRLGDRWVTSREALQRFAEALTPCLDAPQENPPNPRAPGRRQRASERAAAELERLGI
jgi:hypothetical protein